MCHLLEGAARMERVYLESESQVNKKIKWQFPLGVREIRGRWRLVCGSIFVRDQVHPVVRAHTGKNLYFFPPEFCSLMIILLQEKSLLLETMSLARKLSRACAPGVSPQVPPQTLGSPTWPCDSSTRDLAATSAALGPDKNVISRAMFLPLYSRGKIPTFRSLGQLLTTLKTVF